MNKACHGTENGWVTNTFCVPLDFGLPIHLASPLQGSPLLSMTSISDTTKCGQIILLWSKFSCCLYVYACYVVDSSTVYMHLGPNMWMHKHVCTSIPYTGSSTKHHHRMLSKSAGVSNVNSPLAMEMSGDFYRSNLVWLSVFILHILPLKCMVKNSFQFQLKNPQRACLCALKIPCNFNIDVAIANINSRQPNVKLLHCS